MILGLWLYFLGFLGSQANNASTRFRDKHTRVVEKTKSNLSSFVREVFEDVPSWKMLEVAS